MRPCFPFEPSSGYLLFNLIVEKSEMTKLVPNVVCTFPRLGLVWGREKPSSHRPRADWRGPRGGGGGSCACIFFPAF